MFALAKQIQGKWPDTHRDDKLVVMFGGLNVDMAALETLVEWPRHLHRQRLLVQELLTPSFEPHMSHAQEEHTRSQRLPWIYSNSIHRISIVLELKMPIPLRLSNTDFMKRKQHISVFVLRNYLRY